MANNVISTLSEYLLHAGTEYLIFDMGRGITALTTQQFLDIENTLTPAPYPRQNNMWLGILFSNQRLSQKEYIWFLKLPVDEHGMLILATRNQFLELVTQAIGNQLEHACDDGRLPENPYIFIPPQQMLADFNAICYRTLHNEQRQAAEQALDYIKAPMQRDWTALSLQSIADVAANINLPTYERVLLEQLHNLPEPVLIPLLNSLENQPIHKALTISILSLIARDGAESKVGQMALRALSKSDENDLINTFLIDGLNTNALSNIDILIIIAGRHFHRLTSEILLNVYFEKVVTADTSFSLFKGIYTDLVAIPMLRPSILQQLRSTTRSTSLTLAIESLLREHIS